MKNNILIASTKAITINTFLDNFILACYKKKINISYFTSDIDNIDKNLLNDPYNDFLFSLDLPKRTIDFFKILNIFKIIIKVRYFLKKNNFKIIFTHTPVVSHFLRLSSLGLNLNIVYFVHGYRFHKKQNFFSNFTFFIFEYILSFNTKKYILINKEDQLITKKYFSYDYVLINGIGIELIKNPIPKKNITKNIKIGVVAGYKKIKGYDDIIYVANKLRSLTFINFITYGYEDYGIYQKKIISLNLKNIKVNKFTKNIYNEIDKFDILLHLSKREGLSTITIQSLHRGVPVIAYDIRGISDLIIDGYNGFLIKKNNKDLAVKAILKLIDNKDLYQKMQKNCSNSINEKYSKDNSTKDIFKYLNI